MERKKSAPNKRVHKPHDPQEGQAIEVRTSTEIFEGRDRNRWEQEP